jgi:terminase small subunit-like protein
MSTRKRGRPTKYSPAIGARIAARLANGETLRAICRDDGMPSDRMVRAWALDAEHPFSPQYTRAREIGYQVMADELLDIADDGRNDFMTRQTDNGPIRVHDPEAIRRSQLRVDTRKWLLSKALPKIYGDKQTVDLNAKVSFSDQFEAYIRQLNEATA